LIQQSIPLDTLFMFLKAQCTQYR